jgi:NADPH:quinone reductase-like Zn-dependent oxidoreductase
MKAIRLHTKGGPEQVLYEEAPKPVLLEGDALVKVLAGMEPMSLQPRQGTALAW